LHVDVPAVSPADLSLPPARENSAAVAVRVAHVREIQRERYAKLGSVAGEKRIRTNSGADGELLEKIAAPEVAGRQLLTQAAERLRLSARGYHRVLRVARTLADMDGGDGVKRVHVAEALSYRRIVAA
jgi:magnesium chelatase family protein